MNIREEAQKMKLAAPYMAASDNETRNLALRYAASDLLARADEIFAENAKDLEEAHSAGVSEAIIKRLKFDRGKLDGCIAGIEQLISLPDPLGKVTLARELDEGLTLHRQTCPIGVIGVIFEARPDALVQISCLCIKSGNCAILKGGKETANSNRILFDIIKEAAAKAGLPDGCLLQAEQHNEIDELLKCHEYVDLLIPRGSNAFVQYIMNNTQIPVLGHADGICHTYVDEKCDIAKAVKIILDAKTQYTAACNATETLLVNRKIAEELLPELEKALKKADVTVNGTKEAAQFIDVSELMGEDDFRREYLDLKLSVKLVDDVNEAVNHINRFGSHHTDCIISEDKDNIERFMQLVDSAGVYANCSTRFADGFRYGFGAEVGISTSKIHARGPVGLEGLVTYKYRLFGDGHIVAEYSDGTKSFHFRDI